MARGKENGVFVTAMLLIFQSCRCSDESYKTIRFLYLFYINKKVSAFHVPSNSCIAQFTSKYFTFEVSENRDI